MGQENSPTSPPCLKPFHDLPSGQDRTLPAPNLCGLPHTLIGSAYLGVLQGPLRVPPQPPLASLWAFSPNTPVSSLLLILQSSAHLLKETTLGCPDQIRFPLLFFFFTTFILMCCHIFLGVIDFVNVCLSPLDSQARRVVGSQLFVHGCIPGA